MDLEIKNKQSYQGFLYDVSRISRSDLISVTCYESREIYGVTGLYQAFFLILLAVIVLGAMLFSRSLYALLHRPLHVLMDGLEKVRGGDLVVNYTDEKVTLTGDAKLVYTGEAEY